MEFEKVKDSGTRQEFGTGAVRDTQLNKGRFDLINPIVSKRLAQHYSNGAKKYGDNNWQKGIPSTRYMDSTLRHLNSYLEGDRSEDHLAAALWNISGIIYNEEMVERKILPPELHSLPNFLDKQKFEDYIKQTK